MSLPREANPGIGPEASQSIQTMPEFRTTGIRAWLKLYREGFFWPARVPAQVNGREFRGGLHHQLASDFANQIRSERLKPGRSMTLVLPEKPGTDELESREVVVWRQKKNFYQTKVTVDGGIQLECGGSCWQACQRAVDLLSLPTDFVERVRRNQGGLLLVITNRWFNMTTDPAETAFLAVNQLRVSKKKGQTSVISLEPVGQEEKQKALEKGGQIFVVAREAFPDLPKFSSVPKATPKPLKREPLSVKKVDWPTKESDWFASYHELDEQSKARFDDFCQEFGIETPRLQAYFLKLGRYFYDQAQKSALSQRQVDWSSSYYAYYAYTHRLRSVFNQAHFKKAIDLSALAVARENQDLPSFWNPGRIKSFIVWLREEYLPRAFEEAD